MMTKLIFLPVRMFRSSTRAALILLFCSQTETAPRARLFITEESSLLYYFLSEIRRSSTSRTSTTWGEPVVQVVSARRTSTLKRSKRSSPPLVPPRRGPRPRGLLRAAGMKREQQSSRKSASGPTATASFTFSKTHPRTGVDGVASISFLVEGATRSTTSAGNTTRDVSVKTESESDSQARGSRFWSGKGGGGRGSEGRGADRGAQ
ncbi:unnamed protein product, partial [Amoebophrya sp. A120]|eukprot:GSA120T00018111001.1